MLHLSPSSLLAFAVAPLATAMAQQPDAAAVLRQLALPAQAQLAGDRQLVLSPPPKPEAEVAAATVQEAAARLAAAVAKEHRTIDQVAAAADGRIEGVFAFVRDRIGNAVYPGVLRGAQGTLHARCGNAADKALLLAALLNCAGFETRFVRGELPPERVAMLVARQFEAPPDGPADLVAGWSVTRFVEALAQRARRDHAAVRPALAGQLVAVGNGLAETARRHAALAARHIWIQVLDGKAWRDLDPNFAEAEVGQSIAAPATTVAMLPEADHQRLTIRVTAEMLADGAVTRQVALQYTRPVHELADRDVVLMHLPAGGGGAVGDLIAPKRKGSYAPALVVAGTIETGQAVAFEPGTGGGNFADLAGGLAGAAPESALLVGEWLEIEVEVPGLPVTRISRSLLDRVPPAVRASGRITEAALLPLAVDREGRPLAALEMHNASISSGGHDLAAMAQGFAAQAKATDRDDLFALCRRMSLLNRQWQVIADAVLARALHDRPDVRAVYAAPRVFMMTVGATAEGGMFLRSDLMVQDIGLVARDESAWPAAAERRLWHGVLEGALEHEIVASRLGAITAEPRLQSASAGLGAEPPMVLRPEDASAVERATSDVDLAARLRTALASGSVLVIPPSTLLAGGATEDATWWQLTKSGSLRAVLGADYGGAMSRPATRGVDPLPPNRRGVPTPTKPDDAPKSGNGTDYLILLGKVAFWTISTISWIYDIRMFLGFWKSI